MVLKYFVKFVIKIFQKNYLSGMLTQFIQVSVTLVVDLDRGKFFTYVTKTCPNLTTYSRKPGIYNGSIMFEVDIMKKSHRII